MDKGVLQNQIYIILEKEKLLLWADEITWYIDTGNEDNRITYEHSDTLVNLYTGLQDAELKEAFLNYLLYFFSNEKERIGKDEFEFSIAYFSSSTALIFFTLLRMGFTDKAIEFIKIRFDYNKTNVTLVCFLCDLLSTGNEYFDIKTVSSLLRLFQDQGDYNLSSRGNITNTLRLGLANVGYEEIKENILGVNIEINRDKEKLITMISNNSFDRQYEQLLKEIDEYINTNSTIVTSGMIGNMRSFMEGLVTDLARKIAANNNEQIPENERMGTMGNIRSYLKSKLELSDNDNQLINKYIEVLHSEGRHSFTANVEYFRLAKNIGVEISLFLLSKANNLNLLTNNQEPDF